MRQKSKKNLLSAAILLLLAAVYGYLQQNSDKAPSNIDSHPEVTIQKDAHDTIRQYFEQKTSGKVITVTANVSRVLSDDTHKPRHQRFILTLNNDLTVLVAHNIDLAPRVAELDVGDEVTVVGQYEWNERGGVLHWTHHDPKGRRDGGQIHHNGKVYQ